VHHLLLRRCSKSTLTTLFLLHAPVFAHRLPTTAPLSQTWYIQHRCSTHARAEAAPVIRRLRMHAARLSTHVRSLQDPSSTVRPRVRQSSACTSTNHQLHSRPCHPLRATAFSPIPCSSSLSFTPSSSPSTSPIPEREPCASIVQQRRVNIRLMRRLPVAGAASPAALLVSPPVHTPYRVIHSSHTPILGVPTRPFSFPPLRRHRRTCCPPLSIDSRSLCSLFPSLSPSCMLPHTPPTATHSAAASMPSLPVPSLFYLSIQSYPTYSFLLTRTHAAPRS
jgi:hypothetical protein